jgi:hypothetical protein
MTDPPEGTLPAYCSNQYSPRHAGRLYPVLGSVSNSESHVSTPRMVANFPVPPTNRDVPWNVPRRDPVAVASV